MTIQFKKVYNKNNFFKHTYCIFKEVAPSNIPKKKPDYISKSKSTYYFTEEGVYRKSNHWGRAANCRWKLIIENHKPQNEIVAFARWIDFFPNNEFDKIYFIKVNSNFEISYHHKNEDIFNTNDVLRTAKETSKRIKILKEIIETNNWSKHLTFDNYETLKEKFISELLYTNKTIQEIKKECNNQF